MLSEKEDSYYLKFIYLLEWILNVLLVMSDHLYEFKIFFKSWNFENLIIQHHDTLAVSIILFSKSFSNILFIYRRFFELRQSSVFFSKLNRFSPPLMSLTAYSSSHANVSHIFNHSPFACLPLWCKTLVLLCGWK